MIDTFKYIVKKFKLNLDNPSPIFIDVISRRDFAKLFSELNFKKGAEIGIDRGAYSQAICEYNPRLYLYSIDSWSTSSFEDGINQGAAMQAQFERHYKNAVNRLSKYNCTIIRAESLDAIKRFEDNSLDFVYIDANHNFVNIASDIYRWEKKVRPGGIVSGHDYHHFTLDRDNHVKHVVDAYVAAFEIPYYFEFGQGKPHSWFWVK
jgi:hypothetical protein